MISRPPRQRTVPLHDEALSPRDNRTPARSIKGLRADAPLESLRDDGRMDGIPVRSAVDADRERVARLAEIERLFEGTARQAHANNCKPCVLTKGRKRIEFVSVSAACEFTGVNHTNLYTILRRNGIAAGYRWEIGKRAERNAAPA